MEIKPRTKYNLPIFNKLYINDIFCDITNTNYIPEIQLVLSFFTNLLNELPDDYHFFIKKPSAFKQEGLNKIDKI